MPKIIEAVYENGVFKPLEKVDLREGERVRILLRRIDLKRFVMAKMPEEKIRELEKRFENENIY
ncbi:MULTISPECIES: antitoxin family protein [unclassified Archaeoglobus]|jgi:predicted DNA-binding antitoxin AbrB/MazE fold protein|uniref:antitoxin family protein n=1 Tax=unclassified Archaeoglobus TaxID=2643606 RepID=UPI0025C0B17C|nr:MULTISPECIES: antitoxin family protein [unclassified Archaeoglobus]